MKQSTPHALNQVKGGWLIFALFLLLGCGQQETHLIKASQLVEGKPFPTLTLKTLDGNEVDFHPQTDKVVIFNVWGTWCPPCRKELPALQNLKARLDPNRFTLILMAMDTDPLVVREYFIDKALTLPTYIDTELSITKTIFDLKVYPTTFIIDQNGILQRTISGEKQWDHPTVIHELEKLYNQT